MKTIFWVYILECENNCFYTGYTTNLARRYQEHEMGTAKCKYTRSFRPVRIAQAWPLESKSVALRAEKIIKQMSRKQKENLIRNAEQLCQLLTID